MGFEPFAASSFGIARNAEAHVRKARCGLQHNRQILVGAEDADDKDPGRRGRGSGDWSSRFERRRISNHDSFCRPGFDFTEMHRVGDDHGGRPSTQKTLERHAPSPFAAVEDTRMAIHDVARSVSAAVEKDGSRSKHRRVHDENNLGSDPRELPDGREELRTILEHNGFKVIGQYDMDGNDFVADYFLKTPK